VTLDFSIYLRNSSSRTMALGSTVSLKEMNTRNLPVDKWWSALIDDSPTAVCEQII
jgi:hypothetical protein